MTGSEICALIINTVKQYVNSEEFREKYRIGRCFTRVRKLTMGIVMMFLLSRGKKSLPNEIDDFLNWFGSAIAELVGKPIVSFTKQALSKARKGIHLDAFYWLLDTCVNTFFSCKPSYRLWHGLHLFAIDGTDIQLPMMNSCISMFGSQKLRNNSDFPFAKGSCLYSVSTHLIVDVLLERCRYSERELAMRHIDRLKRLPISRADADQQIARILDSGVCARKHRYVSSEGLIAGRLKAYLPDMLSGESDIIQQCRRIIHCATQRSNWVQVMPRRHFERCVKQPGRKFFTTVSPVFELIGVAVA